VSLEPNAIGLLVVGAIVIIGGVLEITGALRNRRLAEQSRAWPRAEGEVIHRDLRRTFLQGIGQVPRVRYGFEAGGQRWEHDHVVFGGYRAMPRRRAEKILSRYPTGTKVQVIHHPNDPRVCALESNSAFVPPVIYGVAMMLTGAIVIVAAFTGL
jgi:hypothetical protein